MCFKIIHVTLMIQYPLKNFKQFFTAIFNHFINRAIVQNSKIWKFKEHKNHHFKIQYLLWYAKWTSRNNESEIKSKSFDFVSNERCLQTNEAKWEIKISFEEQLAGFVRYISLSAVALPVYFEMGKSKKERIEKENLTTIHKMYTSFIT